jgi:general secretion pathway protein I
METTSSTSGFTLFETLIAMLVLSIGLAGLFEANGRALRTVGTAADYAKARIIAHGLLADATTGWSGELTSQKGTSGGLQWAVDVVPETSSWARVDVRGGWKLRRFRVTVALGDGRELVLTSLKFGRSNG